MRRIALLPAIPILCFALLVLATFSWAGDMLDWPVNGRVLKQFAPNEHRGVDILASVGDPVVAAQDGVVHWIGKLPGGEPYISIDHPNGLSATYLPVKATVSKGQSVKKGEKIGELSSEIDKSSDEAHLHFGLFKTATRSNKQYLNPLDYLSQSKGGSGEESDAPVVEKPDAGSGRLPGAEEESGNLPVEDEPATGGLPEKIPEDLVAIAPVAPGQKPEPVQQALVQVKPNPGNDPAMDRPRTGEGAVEGPAPVNAPAALSNNALAVPSPALLQQAVSGVGEKPRNALDVAEESQARLTTLTSACVKAMRPVNPFETTIAGRGGIVAGEGKTNNAQRPGLLGQGKAFNAVFNWRYLPEALSFLTVLSVALSGIRFARNLKILSYMG